MNEINNRLVDSGDLYPRASDRLFSNTPKNIENETLSPTINTNFSIIPILSNFKIRRIKNPGKNVRKINPRSGLKYGMFKRMATSVRKTDPSKTRIQFLFPRLFINLIPSPLTLHKRLNVSLNTSTQQNQD